MIQVARKVLSLIAIGVATSTALLAQAGVTAALPNGREIHPEGNWIPLAPYPFALAVRPDDAQIAAPSIGFSFALNVIEEPQSASAGVRRFPAGHENDPSIEVHAGLAYSPDVALLYVANGDSGRIPLDLKSAYLVSLLRQVAIEETHFRNQGSFVLEVFPKSLRRETAEGRREIALY